MSIPDNSHTAIFEIHMYTPTHMNTRVLILHTQISFIQENTVHWEGNIFIDSIWFLIQMSDYKIMRNKI